MIIEQERKEDFEEIYSFIKTAFSTAEVADGNEQDFVNAIRKSENYIPSLTLTAKENGKIIGFIMLSKTEITLNGEKTEALNLGPVAVLSEKRSSGVGSALIRESLKRAKASGETSVFLAGNPKFYSRFSFVPAINYGIRCNVPVPDELLPNIMVLELSSGALSDKQGGIVRLTMEE
ncbi:MAG: GNAT family N-acetyltransferase [Christensenellales bacterium]